MSIFVGVKSSPPRHTLDFVERTIDFDAIHFVKKALNSIEKGMFVGGVGQVPSDLKPNSPIPQVSSFPSKNSTWKQHFG